MSLLKSMDMKKLFAVKILLVLAVSTTIVGCKRSSSSNSSRATGWEINSKDGGFQYNNKFKEQETSPGLVFVEGGTFTMGKVQDDVMHDWNNTPNQQHVMSFYMDETEVTNKMYTEYLDWIERVYPPEEENFRAIYNGAVPDTLVWRNRLGYNEVMTENYLRHPGYGEYPVVGVSWIQAVEFANWRSDRVNEATLEREGYLKRDAKTLEATADANFSTDTYINSPTNTYGGNEEILSGGKRKPKLDPEGNPIDVYATRETGLISPKYRLPTEAEWEYAARAGTSTDYFFGDRPEQACEYANLADRTTGRAFREWRVVDCEDGHVRMAPVAVLKPSAFGLHDMAGNVSEWVLECGMPSYKTAPNDGSVAKGPACTSHGHRGGSWDSQPAELQSAYRNTSGSLNQDRGFRLVREL